jgi:hypothetical protein
LYHRGTLYAAKEEGEKEINKNSNFKKCNILIVLFVVASVQDYEICVCVSEAQKL